MWDWSTAASLATALGTLVLALATFVAVRAANRAARTAEYSMQIGIRPLLMSSRLTDTEQKIMWGDEHWARLSGSGAIAEVVDDNLYLAMSVRNSGSGVAVIHGWHLVLQELQQDHAHAEPEEFRRQLRDLYVAGDDVGFWQAAIRDRDDPEYGALLEAVRGPASSRSSCSTAITRAVSARSDGSRWLRSRIRCGSAPWFGTGTWIARTPAEVDLGFQRFRRNRGRRCRGVSSAGVGTHTDRDAKG